MRWRRLKSDFFYQLRVIPSIEDLNSADNRRDIGYNIIAGNDSL
jgi:hypothetical protein